MNKKKTWKIVTLFFSILLFFFSFFVFLNLKYTIPSVLNTRISSVNYADQYGPIKRTITASPGNHLVLIKIFSGASDELSYGYADADLEIIDSQGNHYPLIWETNSVYIFDIPLSARGLKLFINHFLILRIK